LAPIEFEGPHFRPFYPGRGAREATAGGWSRAGAAILALVASLGLAFPAPQDGPPPEAGPAKATNLVDVAAVDPGIRLDIRYAGKGNFTGHPLYTEARAILQLPVAQALARANRALKSRGYCLVIWDAYRPWSVTKLLWDSAPPEKRKPQFVADPQVGSMHNRGCAVDVSLYDLKAGAEVSMPSAFDEFTERARADYAGGSGQARRLRDLLRGAMEKEGFEVNPAEWWHFNHDTCGQYPLLDVAFSTVERLPAP
jgi:zinc D-Ala-D-Ala dipeptidase